MKQLMLPLFYILKLFLFAFVLLCQDWTVYYCCFNSELDITRFQ